MIMAVGKGLSPSPPSPLNIATEHHRIAKNMEKVSMTNSRRLAFARQREISMLIGIAMTALLECSVKVFQIFHGHSAPDLFVELSKRASNIIHSFQEQELAQLLWAFASLYEHVDTLLQAMDTVFKNSNQFKCCLSHETSNCDEESCVENKRDLKFGGVSDPPVLSLSRDQLGNIAWSYVVLGQVDRIFFS